MTSLNDLIKDSRKIEIRAKGLVDDNLSGEYKTAFKGRGIDFHDLREYLHGDEVRSIDWNTTARTGDPYVKQFVEQRELSIYLAVDITKSINYGSINNSRHHLAALISTVLSLSAARNGDRVGFIFFSNKIEHFAEPQKGQIHCMKILRKLINHDPSPAISNPGACLEFIMKRQKKRSMIFLISDFLSESFENELKICSHKNDLVAIQIIDPAEIELPTAGKVYVKNPENDKTYLMDTKDKSIQENYKSQRNKWQENLDNIFKLNKIDHLKLINDENCDPAKTLKILFKSRATNNR